MGSVKSMGMRVSSVFSVGWLCVVVALSCKGDDRLLVGGTRAAVGSEVDASVTDAAPVDLSLCPSGSNIIIGTSASEYLEGTAGDDCILGLGGEDALYGLGGNDVILGGPGHDYMQGNGGNDLLYGGAGNDVLDGGDGGDLLCEKQWYLHDGSGGGLSSRNPNLKRKNTRLAT